MPRATLPPDVRSRVLAEGKPQPFGRDEWRAMGALMLLALPVTFFWATYEQQGNTIALWADGYTDRTINCWSGPGKSPSPGSRRSIRS